MWCTCVHIIFPNHGLYCRHGFDKHRVFNLYIQNKPTVSSSCIDCITAQVFKVWITDSVYSNAESHKDCILTMAIKSSLANNALEALLGLVQN